MKVLKKKRLEQEKKQSEIGFGSLSIDGNFSWTRVDSVLQAE
jgi:hypothetical protein